MTAADLALMLLAVDPRLFALAIAVAACVAASR